jgi:hypothetical protein
MLTYSCPSSMIILRHRFVHINCVGEDDKTTPSAEHMLHGTTAWFCGGCRQHTAECIACHRIGRFPASFASSGRAWALSQLVPLPPVIPSSTASSSSSSSSSAAAASETLQLCSVAGCHRAWHTSCSIACPAHACSVCKEPHITNSTLSCVRCATSLHNACGKAIMYVPMPFLPVLVGMNGVQLSHQSMICPACGTAVAAQVGLVEPITAGSFLSQYFQSVYLVLRLSDCKDQTNTMVLQTVLVVNMFTPLVPCTRILNDVMPRTYTKENPRRCQRSECDFTTFGSALLYHIQRVSPAVDVERLCGVVDSCRVVSFLDGWCRSVQSSIHCGVPPGQSARVAVESDGEWVGVMRPDTRADRRIVSLVDPTGTVWRGGGGGGGGAGEAAIISFCQRCCLRFCVGCRCRPIRATGLPGRVWPVRVTCV